MTDPTLEQQIRSSATLIPLATRLSTLTASESDTPRADSDGSNDGMTDGEGDGGEGEIRVLAKRVLELLDDETD